MKEVFQEIFTNLPCKKIFSVLSLLSLAVVIFLFASNIKSSPSPKKTNEILADSIHEPAGQD